jgi:hypothetical protein
MLFPVSPAGEKPGMDSWGKINLGRLNTRRWCCILTNSISGIGNTRCMERGAASNLFRHTRSGRKNWCRVLFMQLLKEFEEIKLREPSKHHQILACRGSRIWIGQRDLTCVRDRYCGIGRPFDQWADNIRYRKGWNALHRHTNGLPTREHYIYRSRYRSQDRPGHDLFHRGRRSTWFIPPVSRRQSLSLSLRSFLCFDLGFSQPEPEEPEPTNDSDRDLRRDSKILIE